MALPSSSAAPANAGNPARPGRKPTPEERERVLGLAREGHTNGVIAQMTGVHVKSVNGIVNNARQRGILPQVPRQAPTPPPYATYPAHQPPPPAPEPAFAPESPPGDVTPPAAAAPPFVPAQGPSDGPIAPPVAAAPPGAVPQTEVPMQQPAYTPPPSPPPPPAGQSAPFPAPANGEGFNWRGGPGANFQFSQHAVKYVVERVVPNDGILGTHPHPFEVTDVGRIYGSGQYRVTKYEPGRPPVTSDIFTIAPTYGAPKMPGVPGERGSAAAPAPRSRWADFRERGGDLEDDPAGPPAPRMFRPYGPGYPSDPRFADFARRPDPAAAEKSESVATEAIRAMSRIQEQAIKNTAEIQKAGPESWLQQWLMAQEKKSEEARVRDEQRREDERRREEKRQEDERRREEQRREDEKRAADERRKEQEAEYRRRLEEEDRKHQRELERIKTEAEQRMKFESEQRQTILALEQKKIEIIQTEAKAREAMWQNELERVRQDFERVTKEMTKQMSQVEQGVSAELDRERDQLRREFDIRNKALDNEHALRTEMLRLREEAQGRSDSDGFLKMVEKIVGEVGKNVKEVVELKKLEVLSPEAQAIAAAKAHDGNLSPNPQGAGRAPQSAAKPAPSPAPGGLNLQPLSGTETDDEEEAVEPGEENDEAPSTLGVEPLSPGAEKKMEEIVKQQLKDPVAQQLLKEWVTHVDAETSPTVFANIFMEYMTRSPDDNLRKACGGLMTFINPRKWPQVLEVVGGVLSAEQRQILEKPYAEEFYVAFKTMVSESLDEYFEQFLEQRRQKKAEQRAAQQAAAAEAKTA